MMEAKQRIFIDLPTEETFAYTSNLENMAVWSSAVINVKKTSPGAIQAGTTVQSTVRFLGKWLDMIFELVEYEPQRYLTLKSISGGTPCLFYYQFDPVANGGVMVSLHSMIHLSRGILDLPEPMVIDTINRQLEYDLLTLKAMLEARIPTRKITN
ncbi:MAG TPA: SRPBCC family protein [Ktedonobacteraceae bacterium]|jgi:hypothetical protein|nr:SRPBCC family protein [Ktedonobacteraceae bacterium]